MMSIWIFTHWYDVRTFSLTVPGGMIVRLNIDGRICAEGLLVFGLGGLAIVYLIAPLLDNLLKKVNRKALLLAAIMLISLFSFDQIYSVKHPNTGAGISSGKTKQMAMRIVESKAVPNRRKNFFGYF